MRLRPVPPPPEGLSGLGPISLSFIVADICASSPPLFVTSTPRPLSKDHCSGKHRVLNIVDSRMSLARQGVGPVAGTSAEIRLPFQGRCQVPNQY